MGETLKLRLVRCPKCENLLQEHPDYSIYQCGGCGAILRAKKGKVKGNYGSQRCDEKRIGVVSEKSDSFSGKSENFLGNCAVSGSEIAEGKVNDGGGIGNSETVAQKIGDDSKPEIGKWVVVDENSSGNQVMGDRNLDSRVDGLDTQIENSNGLTRSGRFLKCKASDRGMEERCGRMRNDQFERGRFSSSDPLDDETFDSSYRNQDCRSTRAEFVDHDREELLRKLDELKDQLIRVQTMNGQAPDNTPLEPRTVEYRGERDGYFRDHPSSFHRIPSHLSASSKHVARPPYFQHYHEPLPIIDGSDVATHNYLTSMRSLNHVYRYEDQFEPQTVMRPQARRIHSHHHRYTSLEPDPYEPDPYSVTLNQPCACHQCYAQQQEVPRHIPPSVFSNRGFPHAYNAREVKIPPIGSRDPQPHTRKPSDLNAEVSAVPRVRPQRVILSKEIRCYPIAGGTPFMTCYNCFKLLKLPKKMFNNKGEWKMSCGACSSVISFAIVDGKLVSVNTSANRTTTDDLGSSYEVGNGHASHFKRDNASFCSEDYANSVYDFQVMDRERVSSSSTCQDITTSKSEEMHYCSVSTTTTTTTTSEDGHFPDELVAREGVTYTAEPCEKADSPPSPGSPPQDSFNYTSKYRAVNRGGKGSLSNRSDQERITTSRSTLRHPSLKETLATEMEIPLDDYADPESSQDSADTNRGDDQQKGKRGVDSFLAGIIKKSFRDLSRSSQTTGSGKRNVTVNGHLIPDRLVKKAEKLAGPIYPGKYWYDYRAGFWGVMGGPCLGIIPSNIQEFNYPMPEKCAGGNTGVLVNGRELNQKDLDLLVTRGLPAARDRSYIIDLSGRVVDADSDKELVNLGKLAPTVEKLKCGFGMRTPEAAA